VKLANQTSLSVAIVWLALSAFVSAQATLLFKDDFTAANGTSLTDPATRATGTLASTVKYAWTNTTDVVVDGTLNWDGNGNRNGQHQQTADTTTQSFRMTYNWASLVAGKVWEVEFDQRVAWSHPLTFGLSDNPQNGLWSAWNDSNYDFATGSYGTNLFYDTDNDGGGTGSTNTTSIASVFPSLVAANPPTNETHHFRIRFDEPNGTATVWINSVQKVQATSLDFENTGRYLSWGEPQQYAGALDNITVSVIDTPPSIEGYSPTQAAGGVYPATPLVATFDKLIALTGAGTITIEDTAGANDVSINVTNPAQVSVSGTNLIITPPVRLAYGTPLEVVIGPGTVVDAASPAGAFPGTTPGEWTFTTAVQEFTAPVITLKNPVDGTSGVSPGANLVATFNENIIAGSGDVVIVDTDDGTTTKTIAVTDTAQVSISGNVLTLNPTTSLGSGKNYAVQIAAGAVKNFSELSFTGIANLTDWNFTTSVPSKVILHEWDVGAAGNTNTLWANPTGGKNLTAANGSGGSTSVVFTPDARVSIGRGFQATNANLNAGAASGLPTASYTFEWWLHFGGAVTPGQVIFESGGNSNGIGLWTKTGGLEFANSSTSTGSDVLASVSLTGLDLTHYVQVVGVCDTAAKTITLTATDVNGVTVSQSAVSAQPIGLGTGDGLSFFCGGNGNFSTSSASVGGSGATGISLPATTGVFSGKIGLSRVWEGVDLTAVAESYQAIVLNAVRANDPRPNIIVIYTDDHGYADLGIQGQDANIAGLTPNIDRLGSEGVRFTSGYVTAPQCVPSRAGILSGRYQQRFGVDQNGYGPMRQNVVTIAERLRKAGYRTGMTGKWHLEPNTSDTEWMAQNGYPDFASVPTSVRRSFLPDQQGFEDFAEGYTTSYWRNFQRNAADGTPLGSQNNESGHRIDIQSDFAVSFIQRNYNRPFMFYLSYYGPHVPLDWVTRYNNSSFFPALPEKRRIALSMIKAMDDGVQRILSELAARGIDNKTIIWFIGDNGAPLGFAEIGNIGATDAAVAWDGSLNTPWTGEKGMLAEGGIRVPFLMRWPGTVPPQVYDKAVISLDVAATANALAGLPATTELDGVNLIPHLTGSNLAPPHERLFWRFWNQCAVREGRWKYLKPSANTPPMLFDMESAEHELKNRIGQFPDIAADLDAKVEAWKQGLYRPGNLGTTLNSQERPWYRRHMGLGIAYEFSTNGNAEGWTPLGVTNPRVDGGSWKGATSAGATLTQEDFTSSSRDFLVAGGAVNRVLVKLVAPVAGNLSLQWAHRDADVFNASRSVTLPVNASPNPQWLAFPMDEQAEWNGRMVTRVRFVFTSSAGSDVAIDSIRASDGDYDRDGIDDIDDGAMDTDGDGVANLEDTDSDGNGKSDHHAWLFGIDHTEPGSVFTTEPSYQNGTLNLDFTAIPGRKYVMEESPDLNGPWQDAATLGPVGSPGTQRLSFTPPAGSPRWFVRLRPSATP
jgi:arylsulfatase A-like enzyme